MSTTIHTALVLFVRSFHEESKAKDLFAVKAKGKQLYGSLVHRIGEQAKKINADFFQFKTDQQKGSNFDEKIKNAFQHFFDEGYDKVILIGNDCPGMGKVEFKAAIQALDYSGLVLGPTNLGGVYLIGCTSIFYNSKFSNQQITWNTNRVYEDLILLNGSDSYILRCHNELNHLGNISSLISQLHGFRHFGEILNIFRKTSKSPMKEISLNKNKFYSLFSLRGPPLLFFVVEV